MNDHPDTPPDAFLSYTRMDDQFYGGAITSLRKLLELGVKVVTGKREFNIFQDVDSIEFGEQFQKRLDEAIANTWFFIPIITPLFFNSQACRGELQKFLAHEKVLARNDLILPIYYVTAPVLEKPDLRAKDSLASEISARERYDWRSQADLPINDPKIRAAVRDLAEKIAAAIARTETSSFQAPASTDVLADEPSAPDPPQNETVKESAFRAASEIVKNEEPGQQSKGDRRTILWVEDKPDNNIFERQALQAYNIKLELAGSTGEALAKLRNAKFDAIISDMGTPSDSQAGYTLLEALRGSNDSTPYFIFGASPNPRRGEDPRRRKAQGLTNVSGELIADVLASLNRKSGSSG